MLDRKLDLGFARLIEEISQISRKGMTNPRAGFSPEAPE
jgi:hypothetical protein